MAVVNDKKAVEKVPGVYRSPDGKAELVVERDAQIAACLGNGWQYVGPVPKNKTSKSESSDEDKSLKEQLAEEAEAARKEAKAAKKQDPGNRNPQAQQ